MVRWLVYVATVVSAIALLGGCAKKDPTITQLGGSEPQRISFGDPKTVQTHFSEKMASCWFGGQQPLLQGYRYEAQTVAAPLDGASQPPPTSSIRIVPEAASQGQEGGAFQVEFHRYNDNTLISTRNLGLPLELASRLKRDIETWIFGRKECSDRDLQSQPQPPQELRLGPALQSI